VNYLQKCHNQACWFGLFMGQSHSMQLHSRMLQHCRTMKLLNKIAGVTSVSVGSLGLGLLVLGWVSKPTHLHHWTDGPDGQQSWIYSVLSYHINPVTVLVDLLGYI